MISKRTSREPRRRLAGAVLAAGTVVTVLTGGTTALAAHAALAGGTISTVAGGVGGPGPATAISLASVNVPGNIYTVAGGGLTGFGGDGGPATVAEFNAPQAVAVDATGNLVIADTNFGGAPADQGNNRVRVVAARTGTFYGVPMTVGDIYTVGGNGQPGFAGDGGPATKAELDGPIGLGVTGAGNLLVADVNDGRVREITR